MQYRDDITIVAIRKVSNFGSLRAFADVEINGILTRDWRVIQEEGKAAWVSPPQTAFEKDGKKQYKRIIVPPDATMNKIAAVLLSAYKQELSGKW